MELTRKVDNGASVSDWLGTAKTAAEVAVARIERVRQESTNDAAYELADAERQLVQALDELRTVRDSHPVTTYNGWKNYETWAVGMYLDGNYTGEGTYLDVLDVVRESATTECEACEGGGFVMAGSEHALSGAEPDDDGDVTCAVCVGNGSVVDTSDDARYTLAETLKDYVERDLLGDDGEAVQGLALDFVTASLSEVDWSTLAEHKLDEVAEVAKNV
jgi:hypothetical protein